MTVTVTAITGSLVVLLGILSVLLRISWLERDVEAVCVLIEDLQEEIARLRAAQRVRL